MSKRKTALDRAIENIDQKIAEHREAIKALELARQHMTSATSSIQRAVEGHPEGGRGI